MKKYTVTLNQAYIKEFQVTIDVESQLSYDELYDEIDNKVSNWRIARLSEQELISKGLINGYVKGSYTEWDGDSEAYNDVSIDLEEVESTGDDLLK